MFGRCFASVTLRDMERRPAELTDPEEPTEDACTNACEAICWCLRMEEEMARRVLLSFFTPAGDFIDSPSESIVANFSKVAV
jgi:hypothetical protein